MPPLSNLHRDVIAAIQLVPRFIKDRFFMGYTKHKCGTPACALGNIRALDKALGDRLENPDYSVAYWHLFKSSLQTTIKTPEQWRDHAIKWLAEQGVDYYKVTAGQEPKAGLASTDSPADIATPAPAVSPESEFHMLMQRIKGELING